MKSGDFISTFISSEVGYLKDGNMTIQVSFLKRIGKMYKSELDFY